MQLKECERKVSGRAFCIKPIGPRFLNSLSEMNTTREILALLSAQTLTMSGPALEQILFELAQKPDGSCRFVSSDYNFKKWNLMFRLAFERHIDKAIDELFDIGPFFSKLRGSSRNSFSLMQIGTPHLNL